LTDPQLLSSSPASEKPANPPLPKATHAVPRAPPKSSNPQKENHPRDLTFSLVV